MKRRLFNETHDAFRDAIRELISRSVLPNMESYVEARSFPRDLWLLAGAQGFLGLDVPEEFGGSAAGDYRFNAVVGEELAKVSVVPPPTCVSRGPNRPSD